MYVWWWSTFSTYYSDETGDVGLALPLKTPVCLFVCRMLYGCSILMNELQLESARGQGQSRGASIGSQRNRKKKITLRLSSRLIAHCWRSKAAEGDMKCLKREAAAEVGS